jgi:membrane protein
MVSITSSLNRAYDIDEARPWWKVRITAISLTVGVAVFVVVAFGLVMIGPSLADRVAAVVGFGPLFAMAWKVLQWPLVFALIAIGIGLIYYFAPDADQDWEWITPGAVLATILWMIASLAFKVYVANFGNYNESYGSLGGVIVLMLWFYISALAVLIGAEMNAEIEHASPHGKAAGEKVPGDKKKLGARAARAFEERQRSLGQATAPVKPAGARTPQRRSLAAYVALGVGLVLSLRAQHPQRVDSRSASRG